MAKEYKVWFDVEEYDDETEEYCGCDLGFSGPVFFDTPEEAERFAHMMNSVGESIDTATAIGSHQRVLFADIEETIEEWRRGRTSETTQAGFALSGLSPDIIIVNDGGDGDANQRR